MSQDLFHDVTDRRPSATGAQGGTLAVSIVAHALVLAAVIVVPLLATDALPMPSKAIDAFIGDAPPPPLPPPPAVARTHAVAPESRPDVAPVEPPDTIAAEVPRPPTSDAFPSVEPATGGVPDGVIGGTNPSSAPQP